MSANVSDKKKALLVLKEKLLKELEYYDHKIKYVRVNNNNFMDDDSSDSDTGLPVLDLGPSIIELKVQKEKLKTCLQATQELTNLQVLQSEVNIMVEDPVLEEEQPVSEAGTWHEVTAECRINFLPFSIMFYCHKPSVMFGPPSYRRVRVSALKAIHEAELGTSVLTSVYTPADAIQVLRSYTIAYRSRRATLASLAEKYGHAVFMEPSPQGGFVLKCADLLEVSWRLENGRSPLAPFHHNMKFNFEYMDECYVKIITHAHKELSKPTIDTEERTFLLSKIISTCLEVRGLPQELNESMESDTESVRVEKRQNIDKDTESPEEKKKREANIMAPPKYLPKKAKPKGKENTVENASKGVKRASSSDVIGSKRAKISDVGNAKSFDNPRVVQVGVSGGNTKKTDRKANSESNVQVGNEITELVNKIDGVVQNVDNAKKKISKTNRGTDKNNAEENTANNVKKVKATSNNLASAKTKVKKDNLNSKDPKVDNANNKNVNLPKQSVNTNQTVKNKETSATNTKTKELNIAGANKKQKSQENNNIKKSTSNKNIGNDIQNSVPKNGESTSKIVKKPKISNKIHENNDNVKNKNTGSNKIPENQNAKSNKGDANTKATKNSEATGKTPDNKNVPEENPKNELVKKSKSENSNKHKTVVTKTKENNEKSNKNKAKEINNAKDGTKTTVNKNKEQLAKTNEKKSVASAKDKANTDVAIKNKDSNTVQKATEKVATSKNSENKVKKPTENNVATNKNKENTVDVATGSVASLNRQGSKDNLNNKKIVQNKQISAYNNKPPLKILNKHNMAKKISKTGTFLKPVSAEKKDGGKISSKIPQKAISGSVMKKNPLRISPRKMASMFKTPQLLNQKMQKPSTNIPRLLKASGTKTKS